MDVIFSFMLFIVFALLILGLIKPKLAFMKSRKSVLIIYPILLIVSFIGVVTTADLEPSNEKVAASEEQEDKKPKSDSKPAKEKKKETPKEETISITAGDLYQAYEDNEIAADKNYKGKLLEVTGTISDFGVDVFGTSYIKLDTGGPFKDTQVFFKKGEDDKIAELSKGESVTVIGTGGGLVITSVVINKSVIK